MSKVYIVRYGYAYGHDKILGVFEDKKEAKAVLSKFLEGVDNNIDNYCYIEKFELIKKKPKI